MARNIMRIVIGASNRLFSSAQDTNWSSSFDSLISRWQQYEDEMNYIRESKKLPMRWTPPAGKGKLSPVTLAEDCLLKQLSDKCSANEMQANEMHQPTRVDEDYLKNIYDEVFEEAGRRYRDKIRTSKKAMKRRLDEEKIPTSGDGPRVQKHSMINPQRLFTPVVKKSPSFTRAKPINYHQNVKQNINTPTTDHIVTSKSNVSVNVTPRKDSDMNVNVKPSQSVQPQSVQTQAVQSQAVQPQAVQPQSVKFQSVKQQSVKSQSVQPQSVQPQSVEIQYEPIHPAASPLVPTHQMPDPSALTQNMTSSLPPAHHITSPLVPTYPGTGSERQTFSQQWNFNRMQRVENQFAPSDMSSKRMSQKPKITFIQPKKSQTLYKYIGSNIPVTYITGPITSMT